jgi:hypothetical protein
MAQTRVFISHATKDKSLVDAFFDLLQTGAGLTPNDTFCTSLEGMGIPAGKNFVEYIKEQVQNPDLVLLILSPNYLDSLFCQCELGAGWALSHNIIPIVVPPTKFADLKAVLAGTQAYRIDFDTDLSELRDQIVSLLRLSAPNTARWDAKKKQFLEALSGILSKIDPPQQIALKAHQELQKKYDGTVEEMKSCLNEIDTLKEQIKRLKECKDRDEVREVERDFSDDWERFEELCENATNLAQPLPAMVIETIYQEETGNVGVPNEMQTWADIRAAAQDDYLHVSSDNAVSVNSDDPKISRYMDALDAVRRFLNALDEKSTFKQEYKEKYDHRPVFSSRKLWEEHLGLLSHTKW